MFINNDKIAVGQPDDLAFAAAQRDGGVDTSRRPKGSVGVEDIEVDVEIGTEIAREADGEAAICKCGYVGICVVTAPG